jgi:dephospho-CoA kinase
MTCTIGLTGNIACGKSTVAGMLGQLGALVIDADLVAHQLMQPGTTVYQAVIERFGCGMLAEDGSINRAALGAIVFSDSRALADLERLTHPAVIEHILELQSKCKQRVMVVEAIKLLEAQMQHHCNAIWVVTCTYRQQMERLHLRNLTVAQAELRIAAQPPLWEKLRAAHVVIDNSSSLEQSQEQVLAAWKRIPGTDF